MKLVILLTMLAGVACADRPGADKSKRDCACVQFGGDCARR